MSPITLSTPQRSGRTSAPRSRKPTRPDLQEEQPRNDNGILSVFNDYTNTNSEAVNPNNTAKGTPTKPALTNSANLTSAKVTALHPQPSAATPSVTALSRSRPISITTSPQKKRRYIPGGPGGGGRYVDSDGNEEPVGGTGPGGYNYIGPRGRVGRENAEKGLSPNRPKISLKSGSSFSPSVDKPKYIRPERREKARSRAQKLAQGESTRTRIVPARNSRRVVNGYTNGEGEVRLNFGSLGSSSMASEQLQGDGGYKPREERGWEEFHPELDTEARLPVFTADEVDGVEVHEPSASATPERGSRGGSFNGIGRAVTPREEGVNGPQRQMSAPGTPGMKSRSGRTVVPPVPWASRVGKVNGTSATASGIPRIAPLQNQNAKERLTLPQPSFRKVDTFAKLKGMGHKVDKIMASVGYQDTEIWERPQGLIKLSDSYLDDDLDMPVGSSENIGGNTASSIGRVEYDMDSQDDHWLRMYNAEVRKPAGAEDISHELFEMTLTKIEKEWHALEKRIPKPNPKPPQTQRPRSSSAAAVNGEPLPGEEQDSKCAICDDGDCENTNAIVFCDGCDLAVHQECYGVPFIPEGQWLCRKCQLIGRGIPTCIFCPNTDGGFKQTNSSRWAHLLCAMWIPEVSLGNHIFMEPVMDVEKVPKPRWKLSCYICQQQMGACIQCGNKACYQAFHVTCARRARLFLKMKNSTGTLIELDGGTHLKAFCDKHCPMEYSRENNVAQATREARMFYKQTMKGRIWADSQAAALQIAAAHPDAALEHAGNEPRPKHRLSFSLGSNKKRKEEQKNVWKLPSGAPVIPAYVFNLVEQSLKRFSIGKRRDWVAAACKYWTLKREARRGAALLKRLQLPMEPFSSMEITRRNFAAMGEAGRMKLEKRREFVALLVKDMDRLMEISDLALQRETLKLEEARLEKEVFDLTYFPVARLLPPIIEKAISLDKQKVFAPQLDQVLNLANNRYYTHASILIVDLSAIFREGIQAVKTTLPDEEDLFTDASDYNIALKQATTDVKERKKLTKKIIKAIQPVLSEALRAEADVCKMTPEQLTGKLADMDFAFDACVQATPEEILGPARKEGSPSADELVGPAPPILPPTTSYAPILPPGSVKKSALTSASPAKVSPIKALPAPAIVPVVQEDIEMHDADAEGEEIDEDDIFTPIPSVPSTTREASESTAVKAEPTKDVGGVNGDIASMPPPPSRPSLEPPPAVTVHAPVTERSTGCTIPTHSSSKSPTPLSTTGDFLTKGGLPWYLKEAEYDPETESFPKEKTPAPEPELMPQPDAAEATPDPPTSPLSSLAGTSRPVSRGLSEAPTAPVVEMELPPPAKLSPMKSTEALVETTNKQAEAAVDHPSEAETVHLPDYAAPPAAPEDDKMLLDEPETAGEASASPALPKAPPSQRGVQLPVFDDSSHFESSSAGELSDMDDEELDGLGAGMEIGDGVIGIRRGNRKRKKVTKE